MSAKLRQSAVPLFLIACLLLGGSPQGIWRNLLLQIGGLGLIAWALIAVERSHPTSAGRLLLWLCGLWFALVLMQLVPLPPAWWSALPGRAPVLEGFELRGEPLPWLPLSLAPAATWSILPVMAVPLGLIAAVVVLGAYRSLWVIGALVIGTCLSVLLGAVQLSQGGPYLYDNYNTAAATGLFANSNHQATLLLATLPFLGALIGLQQQSRSSGRRSRQSAALGRIVIALGAVAVIVLGIILNGSMAGLALLMPVALATLAVSLPTAGKAPRVLVSMAVLLMLGEVVALASFTNAGSNTTSLATRSDIYRVTWQAIGDTFPVGTGLGSFREYYRLYENPALVDSIFLSITRTAIRWNGCWKPACWARCSSARSSCGGRPGPSGCGGPRSPTSSRWRQPSRRVRSWRTASSTIRCAMRRSRRCSRSRSPSWSSRAATPASSVGALAAGRRGT